MTLNWLVPAEIANLLATSTLLIIFINVYRRRPTEFSILWILGWGIYVTRYIFGIFNALQGPSTILGIAYNEATALSSIILLRAAIKVENPNRFRLYGTLAFAAVSAWIVYGTYFIQNSFWVLLPTFFFFGAAQILTGYYFLRANQDGHYIGGYLAGWGFIIWGIHKLDYPFVRPIEWFAPIGYLIGAFLTIMVGIGILMLMFEQSEDREKALSKALAKDKAALQKSEERFKYAMEASQDGVWDWNVVTGEVYFSPAYFAMLGYSANDLQPNLNAWLDLIHPEDKDETFKINNECIENIRERFEVEFRMKASNGSWRWILGQGKAVTRGAQMRALRMVGTHTDITDRKRAEEEIRLLNADLERRVEERTRQLHEAQDQLVAQEKLAVLAQLADGVGYELRNPLGVISNAVYFLKIAQPEADHKIKEYLDIIEKQIHVSDKIVTDLLNFTHIRSLERAWVSIPKAAQQALERFPPPEEIQVELDLHADLPQVYADPQHLTQALGNLILNACQAMPAGANQNASKLTVSARAESAMICVAVEDTGVGIAPENMPKLFEPLFTTKPKGIGLGLAVTRKLIESNGGRIEIESELGKGSKFKIYLPLSE